MHTWIHGLTVRTTVISGNGADQVLQSLFIAELMAFTDPDNHILECCFSTSNNRLEQRGDRKVVGGSNSGRKGGSTRIRLDTDDHSSAGKQDCKKKKKSR